jgi:hypothetical protein
MKRYQRRKEGSNLSFWSMWVTSNRVRSPLDRTTIGAGNNSVGLTSKVQASKGQPQRHPGRKDAPTARAPKNCNIGDKADLLKAQNLLSLDNKLTNQSDGEQNERV